MSLVLVIDMVMYSSKILLLALAGKVMAAEV
jgi:hypothetical protein